MASTGLLVAAPASADPTGAKDSFTFPAECTDGTVQDLVFVVKSANGNGSGPACST